MAGRIGILNLYSLSKRERDGVRFDGHLDFSLACLLTRQQAAVKTDIVDVLEHIWRGGIPQVFPADAEQRQEYYSSYIDTYLMRDVAERCAVSAMRTVFNSHMEAV